MKPLLLALLLAGCGQGGDIAHPAARRTAAAPATLRVTLVAPAGAAWPAAFDARLTPTAGSCAPVRTIAPLPADAELALPVDAACDWLLQVTLGPLAPSGDTLDAITLASGAGLAVRRAQLGAGRETRLSVLLAATADSADALPEPAPAPTPAPEPAPPVVTPVATMLAVDPPVTAADGTATTLAAWLDAQKLAAPHLLLDVSAADCNACLVVSRALAALEGPGCAVVSVVAGPLAPWLALVGGSPRAVTLADPAPLLAALGASSPVRPLTVLLRREGDGRVTKRLDSGRDSVTPELIASVREICAKTAQNPLKPGEGGAEP